MFGVADFGNSGPSG